MTRFDNGVVVIPPTCPDCGTAFRLASAEATRYYVCPKCELVRLLPLSALLTRPAPTPRITAV